MKRLIFFFLILLCKIVFPQDPDDSKAISSFRFSVLGGAAFSSNLGGSFLIEGKTNLTQNLDIKLSVGYSYLNKDVYYSVKTYGFLGADQYSYRSVSYNVNKILYDVFPASLGFEYTFMHDKLSPYGHLEIGYNYFNSHLEESPSAVGEAYATTLQGLPAEYRNDPPRILDGKTTAYRIAFGIGTNYKLTQNLNLDVRYVYQINKLLVNSNQLLIGLNF